MQSDSNYSTRIRPRLQRFVLPLKPTPNEGMSKNLVTLKDSKAEAFYLSNGDIFVRPEMICNNRCDTPAINKNYLGK